MNVHHIKRELQWLHDHTDFHNADERHKYAGAEWLATNLAHRLEEENGNIIPTRNSDIVRRPDTDGDCKRDS